MEENSTSIIVRRLLMVAGVIAVGEIAARVFGWLYYPTTSVCTDPVTGAQVSAGPGYTFDETFGWTCVTSARPSFWTGELPLTTLMGSHLWGYVFAGIMLIVMWLVFDTRTRPLTKTSETSATRTVTGA